MASKWSNFKNISSRPLFTVIFRPEMLTFYPYSKLTRKQWSDFVVYCVLNLVFHKNPATTNVILATMG